MMRKCIGGLFVCAIFAASSLTYPQTSNAQQASSSPAQAQGAASQSQSAAASTSSVPNEVDQLKRRIQAQQKQIEQLQSTLAGQQQLLDRLSQKDEAKKPAQASTVPAAAPLGNIAGSKDAPAQHPEVATTGEPPLPASTEPASLQGIQNPVETNAPIPAIPLKIGAATLTPVGFVDATEFFRTENLGSGIGTSFSGVPFSDSVAGHLTENRLSVQNSRIGAELDSAFHGWQVRGYWESDFLGYQPNGAFQTSNSDSFRIRLYWARVRMGKFDFMAGQSWSLMTPGRVGISPMPSNLFYSQDMDTNYQLGLTWSRQLQFRFTYHASPAVTAALSIEDSDPYTAGAVVPTAFVNEVDNGTNNAGPAFVPDIVGKLAFDPKVNGRDMHFEFTGLLSAFKTYNPATNATNTATGGGGEFNFNLELWKNFHLLATSYYSSGGGRYIIGLAPDYMIRPDGTISTVQAASGIAGFEYQFVPQTMFYAYYGAAYIGRNFSVVPATTPTGAPTYYGWGYPGSSSSQDRALQEPTFGWIQTFWKSPRYGALQLITQFSYLNRAPWYVAPGAPRIAHLSMAYADIRYVLP